MQFSRFDGVFLAYSWNKTFQIDLCLFRLNSGQHLTQWFHSIHLFFFFSYIFSNGVRIKPKRKSFSFIGLYDDRNKKEIKVCVVCLRNRLAHSRYSISFSVCFFFFSAPDILTLTHAWYNSNFCLVVAMGQSNRWMAVWSAILPRWPSQSQLP